MSSVAQCLQSLCVDSLEWEKHALTKTYPSSHWPSPLPGSRGDAKRCRCCGHCRTKGIRYRLGHEGTSSSARDFHEQACRPDGCTFRRALCIRSFGQWFVSFYYLTGTSNDFLPILCGFKAKHSIGRRSTMSLRRLAASGTMLAGQTKSKEKRSR
jgi:hypothetical protein